MFFILGFVVSQVIGEINLSFDKEESSDDYYATKLVDITYENLTEEEINSFNSVFKDINYFYLKDNRVFRVVKNITRKCNVCEEKTEGTNINKGEKILIEYTKNKKRLKTIICHEILHTYTLKIDDNENVHKIVEDIAKKHVCFR